jgi:purine-nucleoside phosphorylase
LDSRVPSFTVSAVSSSDSTDVFPAASAAAEVIAARAGGLAPEVGVVLGSGLGPLADDVAEAVVLPYSELPGFPEAGVAGHAGRLVLGRVGETPVALMQGRAHLYEHGRADGMKTAVATLAAIGCRTLVLTNAAGSLDPDLRPGSVMLISDHLSLTGVSPLFGESGSERFVDMVDAYSPRLRARLRALAQRLDIELREGVYVWFSGPQFETPAEIRAAKILGGTAVGMSTVPEVILARRAGLEVAALSVITNLAAGMSTEKLSHEQTMRMAGTATETAGRLVRGFLDGES